MNFIDFLFLIRFPNVFTLISEAISSYFCVFSEFSFIFVIKILSVISVYWIIIIHNDIVDLPEDKLYKRERPIVSNRIRVKEAKLLLLILITIFLFIISFLSFLEIIIIMSIFLLGILYNILRIYKKFRYFIPAVCRYLHFIFYTPLCSRNIYLGSIIFFHVLSLCILSIFEERRKISCIYLFLSLFFEIIAILSSIISIIIFDLLNIKAWAVLFLIVLVVSYIFISNTSIRLKVKDLLIVMILYHLFILVLIRFSLLPFLSILGCLGLNYFFGQKFYTT